MAGPFEYDRAFDSDAWMRSDADRQERERELIIQQREDEEYRRALKQREDYEGMYTKLGKPFYAGGNALTPQAAGAPGPPPRAQHPGQGLFPTPRPRPAGPAFPQGTKAPTGAPGLNALAPGGAPPSLDTPLPPKLREVAGVELNTYGELLAAQDFAKNTHAALTPLVQAAFDAKNPSMAKTAASYYRRSPLPIMQAYAGMLEAYKPTGDGGTAWLNIQTPADLEAAKQMFPEQAQYFQIGQTGAVKWTTGADGKRTFTEMPAMLKTPTELVSNKGSFVVGADGEVDLRGLTPPAWFDPQNLKSGDTVDFTYSPKTGEVLDLTVKPKSVAAEKADTREVQVSTPGDVDALNASDETKAALKARLGEHPEGFFVTARGDNYEVASPQVTKFASKGSEPAAKPTTFPNSRTGIALAAKNLKLPPEVVEQAKAFLGSPFQKIQFTKTPGGWAVDAVDERAKSGTSGGSESDEGGALPARPWDSTDGAFGEQVKQNKDAFERQLIGWMMALARNPNAVLFSRQGANNAKLDAEARYRVADYMERNGIDPSRLVDAGAARAALGKVRTQNAIIQQNATVAEAGFARLARLRKEGKISTGAPAMNIVANFFRKWNGDPKVAAAQGVLIETIADYAKVVAGQTGAGGVTKKAQETAEELMALSDNPKMFDEKLREYGGFIRDRVRAGKRQERILAAAASFGKADETKVEPTIGMTLKDGSKITGRKYDDATGKWLVLTTKSKGKPLSWGW